MPFSNSKARAAFFEELKNQKQAGTNVLPVKPSLNQPGAGMRLPQAVPMIKPAMPIAPKPIAPMSSPGMKPQQFGQLQNLMKLKRGY